MLNPDLIMEGKLGAFLGGIQESGCEIDAMQSFNTEQLEDLQRSMGSDGDKVIKKIVPGKSILMEVSHPKGYRRLLEEMLRVEGEHGTGYTHFDKGDERLSEQVFL